MKTKILMILLALIIFGAGSCKKGDTGPIGPEGEKGDKGDKGDVGATGQKGADGSMFYSGTVVPAATLGKVGDFYFRTNTYDLYGPKTAAGWGKATNIKGEDGKDGRNGTNGTNGTNGKDGSQFLSGTSIPAATLGKVGDFYFNTAQMVLYGPKSATGWGVGTNLKAEARVMYSGWKTAVRTKDSIMDGTVVRIAHIYAPQITDAVIANSVVMMYLDYGGGLFPLPYTSRAGGRMSTITFKLKKSELVVYRMVYDGGALLNLGSFIKYRYVIIPGNLYMGMKDRNVDLRDPVAVEKALKEMNE